MRFVPLCALMVMSAVPAQAAAPISGKWYTDGKDSIMEIGPCGAKICGKVIRIIKGRPDGKPAIDTNNPNPSLRTRSILGATLFSGFADGGIEWTGGTLYDPRAGKAYKGTLAKLKNGNLKVTGCWGPFCRSKIFTPAE
jgi:uncharacterized protein (DUF2147 family)